MKACYEFQNHSKLICGTNALQNISGEFRLFGCSAPLLLSDQLLDHLDALKGIRDLMQVGSMPIRHTFASITTEVTSALINEAALVALQHGCDCILAIGSDTAIDVAKGARLLLAMNESNIWSLSGSEALPKGKNVPLIVVPDNAGIHSESSSIFVRHSSSPQKREISSYFLQPDVTILDIRMNLPLSQKTTAANGIASLSRAIEAYSGLQKNILSDAYAISSLQLIRDYLFESVNHMDNPDARLAMAQASYLSGVASANSKPGLVHALAQAICYKCHVPLAECICILLPSVMKYQTSFADSNYSQLLLYVTREETYFQTSTGKRSEKLIEAVSNMRKLLHDICGLPLTLKDIYVNKAVFSHIAELALTDSGILVTPGNVTKEDLIRILNDAYQ